MNTTAPTVITETTVIAAGERIDYTDTGYSNGAVIVSHSYLSSDPYPELIIRGVINAVENTPGSFGTRGVAYWANGGFGLGARIDNSGEIRATAAHGEAIGIIGNDYSPQVINSGLILAEAPNGVARGLWLSWLAGEFGTMEDSRTHLLVNSGAITARGGSAVIGLQMSLGAVENSGTILAQGHVNLNPTLAYEISGIGALGVRLVNTGSIIAENEGTVDAYGVWIRPDAFNAPRDSFIDNRGVITGDYSILEWDRAGVKTEVLNSGTLNGKVDLGGGEDILVNSGRINGDALLGSGADIYDGARGSSSSVVDGGDGDDILIGGASADTLKGGAGDDLIATGAGADVLQGGAGKDIFVLGAGGAGRISDFDFTVDRLGLDSGGFLSATVSNGATILTYAGGTIQIDGVTDRTLAQWNALVTKTVVGGGHDDALSGSDFSETLIGGAGVDAVSWLGSTHGVTVGLHIVGAQDTGSGLDTLISIENLIGSNFGDALTGDIGDNRLWGEAGNDWLTGGGGDDVLDGGLGDDVIDGGAGFDTVDYSRATAGINITVWTSATNQTTVMGSDTLYSVEAVIGTTFNDTIYARFVEGGGGDDVLHGDYNSLLFGGDGNDQLYGIGGVDELHGGAGGDFVQGGSGDDTLYGDDGADVIYGGWGRDELYGGEGADTFIYTSTGESPVPYYGYYQEFPDYIRDFKTGVDKIDVKALTVTNYWITQDVGAMTLHVMTSGGEMQIWVGGLIEDEDLVFTRSSTILQGGAGGETLIGGIGNDALWGAAGDDMLIGGGGRDELRGEAGTDTVFGEGGNDLLAGGDGDDSLMGQTGDDVLFGETGNDTLLGGLGRDALFGQDGTDKLYGEDGDDQLYGGLGDDALYGQAGADVLWGEDGADQLIGGLGDDVLYGQDGADTLYGEDGADLLIGGAGNDFLAGQAGADTLFGETGDDFLVGGANADFLAGQDGDDVLYGEDGTDTLVGGEGADQLYGHAGVDTLYGEAGADALFGGDGADFLAGQAGADQLSGGAGADIFYYAALAEGGDTILDFNSAEGDKIIVDAAAFGAFAGFQLTTGVGFVSGAGAAPTAATATFYYDTTTHVLWYDVDGTGGSQAQQIATFADNPTLQASDFIFG